MRTFKFYESLKEGDIVWLIRPPLLVSKNKRRPWPVLVKYIIKNKDDIAALYINRNIDSTFTDERLAKKAYKKEINKFKKTWSVQLKELDSILESLI